MWSQTPTKPKPASSHALATAMRSSTVAVSSQSSRSVRVSVWMGSCMPYITAPSGTIDIRPPVTRKLLTGLGQAEVVLGDEVALDLAGATVDGGHGRVAGGPVDPAVAGGPFDVELQEALGAGDGLARLGG